MNRLAVVVEGHGEVGAVPILLRRIGEMQDEPIYIDVPTPIRTSRNRFLRNADEFRRVLLLADAKAGEHGGILVLLDADEDCPAQLGPATLARAEEVVVNKPISVVLAKREYEAWFLAAAESLAGKRGLPDPLGPPDDPEAIGGAKGWITNRMQGSRAYRETLDQPALTQIFDISMARGHSPSFDKFTRDVIRVLRVGQQS
jgi:hypothetical protein